MSENENVVITDESKTFFRSSAVWIRAYAIILLIFLGIMGLMIIILSADKNGSIVGQMLEKADPNLKNLVDEVYYAVILCGAIIIAVLGYAVSKLLSAGNSFTAISYTGNKDEVIKAFKGMKTYWMYYGISLILMIIFGVFIAAKVIVAGLELKV